MTDLADMADSLKWESLKRRAAWAPRGARRARAAELRDFTTELLRREIAPAAKKKRRR